jgi:hypothetical protein
MRERVQGRPLTPEEKYCVVTLKQYFDRNKDILTTSASSVELTADIGKQKIFPNECIVAKIVDIRRQGISTRRKTSWPSEWMAWEQSLEALTFRRGSIHEFHQKSEQVVFPLTHRGQISGRWHKAPR